MELKNTSINFDHQGINAQVSYYSDRFNVVASLKHGARAETLTVSYDAQGVREPADVDMSAPFDQAFFAALEAKIAILIQLV